MKKSVKKAIYGMVTIISLFLACAEAETAFNQVLWSSSMLLICGLSAKGFENNMTEEEKEERV